MKKLKLHDIYRHDLLELLIYIAVWTIIILAPVVTRFFELLSGNADNMHWIGVFHFWAAILPFFILFVINNKVLLPYLFFRQKITLYVICTICLSILIFFISSLLLHNRDNLRFKNFEKQRMELLLNEKSFDGRPTASEGPFFSDDEHWERTHENHNRPDARRKPWADSMDRVNARHFPHPPFGEGPLFFPLFRGTFLGRMLIALLMYCFSIAVKLFFRSLRDKEAMRELERNKLQTELDYLKYQINPHFFMNTLNNIHALVDIDTEKAKRTLVKLSRLMRYVLYESNHNTIALGKEVEFLQHYVELMQIRYTDNVKISLSVPDHIEGIQIPPLLFISFVENAFKHGISYRSPSFVSVNLRLKENEIEFFCSNSNFNYSNDQHHGIGLDNIRKRLLLLYAERYDLVIDESPDCFSVRLTVPINGKF